MVSALKTQFLRASMSEVFEFGANWAKFLRDLGEDQVRAAEQSAVKRLYMRLPDGWHWLVTLPVFFMLWAPKLIRDLLVFKPFATWRKDREARGTRSFTTGSP